MEDDEALQLLLKHILRDQFTVVILPDGLSGIQWLSQGNMPDLILCDFMLPKINGFDFLSNLKKSGMYKNIPVIMLSSVIDDDFKARCITAGAAGYQEKPFNPPVLLEAIKSNLQLA